MIPLLYFGFLGGVVRSLVGLMKSNVYRRKFDAKYLLFTLVSSGIVGMAAGLLIMPADYRLVLLAGYAGTDLLEGLYKTKFKMGVEK